MSFLWATLLILILVAGWVLTLLGMPGNWLMVAAAALYAWLIPEESPCRVGWDVVSALVVLACLGELVELVAGALGAAKAGGSKRAAALSLVGSLIGAIVGVVVGVPIPVVGSLVGAVVFAGIGALAGAMLGEIWAGQTMRQSWRVGHAAFWGRLLGTVAKSLVASVMVVLTAAALVF